MSFRHPKQFFVNVTNNFNHKNTLLFLLTLKQFKCAEKHIVILVNPKAIQMCSANATKKHQH